MKSLKLKHAKGAAIKTDCHDTHPLRSMGFKFSPKQFRYGGDDWFGMAKRIDGDVEGKMRVWQVYLAQPPLLQLFRDHVFWQAAPAEARDQKVLLCVEVADVPAALAFLDADFAVEQPSGLPAVACDDLMEAPHVREPLGIVHLSPKGW